MINSPLDILFVILLWFTGIFLWYFLMHHIRFKLLKYYMKRGFSFYHVPYVGSGSFSSSLRQEYQFKGLASLGWPVNENKQFTLWILVDCLYYLVVLLFPIICFAVMLNLYLHIYRELFDDNMILNSATIDTLTFILCMVLFAVLPHFWIIYFNRKRYKYYITHIGW